MLSGSDLCDGPIAGPEESYQVRFIKLCVTGEPQQQKGLGTLGLLSHEHKLTPHTKVLSENLLVSQQVILPTFSGSWGFITIFKQALDMSLS
jgi:hypothetical protein